MNLKLALELRKVLLATAPENLFKEGRLPVELTAKSLPEIRDVLTKAIAERKGPQYIWKALLLGGLLLGLHLIFVDVGDLTSTAGRLHMLTRVALPALSTWAALHMLETTVNQAKELLTRLTPLADYEQCVEVLKRDEAYPECRAYREAALAAQGEFLHNDYLNIRKIGDRALATKKRIEVQAKLMNPASVGPL